MKIKYKLKPEQERPLKIEDKVRVKKKWLEKEEYLDILKQMDIEKGEASTFGTSEITEEGFRSSRGNFPLMKECLECSIIVQNKDIWYVPVDCLEKVVVKKKKPLTNKNIQKPVKTIGKPMKSKVPARVVRVKHK